MKKVSFLVVLVILLSVALLAGCQGSLVTQLETPQPIPDNAKLVWIFFDDCWQDQFDTALPVLKQNGFKATFGVIIDGIGGGEEGYKKYMGEKELKKLADSGMEIACHSWTHPNLAENLSDQELQHEIIDSKKYLEDMGFKINTFVYPYYAWDERVINYVKNADYVCARAGWPDEEPFDLSLTNPDKRYHIPNYQIIGQNLAAFKSIVNQASRSSIVCITYHHIVDNGPETTSTPVANFVEQMTYLKEAGFTVIILPDYFLAGFLLK